MLVELFYIVFANWMIRKHNFLDLFNVNENPQKLYVKLESPKSYWPGQLSVKSFEISGHDGSVKWKVRTSGIRANITLMSLFKRTLEFENVRVNKADVEILLNQGRLPQSPPNPNPYLFKFHKIKIKDIGDIVFHDYRFKGELELNGSFDLLPGLKLNLWNSDLNFKSGDIFHFQNKALSSFKSQITATILDYNPQDDKDIDVLNHVNDASIAINGRITEGTFLNWYLKDIPWLGIKHLTGDLSTKILIKDGVIANKTEGKILATSIGLKLGDFVSKSKGEVSWKIQQDDLKLNTKLIDHRFYFKTSTKPVIKGSVFSLNTQTPTLNLIDLFTGIKDFDVGLHAIDTTVLDLSFINDFIPVDDKFRILSGEAKLNSKIYLSNDGKSRKGFFNLKTTNAATKFKDTELTANIELNADIQDTEPDIEVFEITNTKLKISNVNPIQKRVKRSQKIKNWKGEVFIPKAYLRPYHNVVVSGSMNLNFDSAEPFLYSFGQDFRFLRILQKVADLDHLNGRLKFQIGPGLVSIDDLSLASSDLNLIGNYRFTDDKHRYLVWLKFETLKAAIEYNGRKISHAVNNTLNWFEKRRTWPEIEIKKK